MKRTVMSLIALSLFSLGTIGCADKATTKTEVQRSGPNGTTTETTTKEIKQTGDMPPAPTQR
jgi:hypothetical protein